MMTNDDAPRVMFNSRIRRSPYFAATRRYGAKAYSTYNHMFLPTYYEDPVADYWKLINDVALWDVGVERQVEITGPDAFAFTNLLTSRDLTQCAVGQCKYVVITAEDGGIINDPVLLRLGENHFWLSLSDSDVLLWAKGLAVHAGMDVQVREPDVSPVQLQGPKSKQVTQALFDDRVRELAYYEFVETELNGMPVVVARTGWTAEVGYEIYLRDGSRGDELWETVMVAGKPYNIAPTGPSHIRRMEAGILNYGNDITLEDNPYQVGIGWLVDLDQEADFVGKAALKRIKAEGVTRKLVGVEIQGSQPLEPNQEPSWPVSRDGKRIGDLRSFVFSPRLQKTIGYAMVSIEHSNLGTQLTLETSSGEAEATVVKKPFMDPKKDLPKS